MRQRIVHGTTIDAATPDEVARIVAGTFTQEEDKQYHQEKGAVNLDATGAGIANVNLGRLYGWSMERVTFTALPAAAALIQLYENTADGADMREVVQLGTAGLYSDGFANKMYIPPGSKVVVSVVSGTANGQLLFNFQCELIRAAKG